MNEPVETTENAHDALIILIGRREHVPARFE